MIKSVAVYFRSLNFKHSQERTPMKNSNTLRWTSLSALTILASGLLMGCATQGLNSGSSSVAPVVRTVSNGRVHGGQQPLSGATIQLWGVGLTGYGSASQPLLTTTVTTSDGTGIGGNAGNGFNSLPTGNFNITGDYSCPSSDLVYITAVGGNPGIVAGTNNTAISMMTALGSCSDLLANAATEFTNINELTTVASVWALSRFMNSYSSVGAPVTNIAGLTNAFAAVNKLVNISTGISPGPQLPAGATLPVAELNTLADILAACVNTAGGTANDGTDCGKLFQYTTQGSSVPADTLGAALNLARNPGNNVDQAFGLSVPSAPFQPTLLTAPGNWMVGINYTGAGLNVPTSMAVDSHGSVWLTNTALNTVSKFDNTGAAVSGPTGFSANSALNAPSSIAIDLTGNAWIANTAGNTIVQLNSSGSYVGTYTANSTLSAPTGLAMDGFGDVWIANSGNNSVSELNNSGTFLGSYTPPAGINAPVAIAINAH